MKKQIIKILAIGLFLLWGFGGYITAQDTEQSQHEVSIYAGGGLSSLLYNLNAGKYHYGFGGQAGIGYSFFFTPNFSLGTGAEFALYQAKASFPSGFSDSYVLNDPKNEGFTYTFKYKVNNYSEQQQAFFINIPLMLQFQTGENHKFFAALGGKVGFPFNAIAKKASYMVNTEGEYSYEERTYDDLPQHGYGLFNYPAGKVTLDKLKLNIMASAEVGMKWKIGDTKALYTGLYADYGFNNIQKTNNKIFVKESESSANPIMSPLIESRFSGNSFTNKITPIAVGLKIRFAFSIGNSLEESGRSTSSRYSGYYPQAEPAKPIVENYSTPTYVAPQNRVTPPVSVAPPISVVPPASVAVQSRTEGLQSVIKEIQKPISDYSVSQTIPASLQKQDLDKKIDLLKQYPNLKFEIYGHTCDVGNDETKIKMGIQRAEAIKAYMIIKGIDASRILGTSSKLDWEPIVQNSSEENRRINRRVEIVVK